MPRQVRRLPVGINRFTYWIFVPCRPATADELARRNRFPSLSLDAGVFLLERFIRHVNDGACGDFGCRTDPLLQSAKGARRSETALKDFIEGERLWAQRPQAQRVFKTLPAGAKQRLAELSGRLYGRRGRRTWKTLLEAIARDQRLFACMLPDGPKRLRDDSLYPSARKVWTMYARQALVVLGDDPAESPDARERARLDLTGRSADERAYVLHWFAHAFRGLVRHRNRDEPLPFSPDCAAYCQRIQDRFARSDPPT